MKQTVDPMNGEPDDYLDDGLDEEPEGCFHAELFRNGQFTMKKKHRDEYGVVEGDVIFLKVVRVIAPSGQQKYPKVAEV